MKHTSMFAIIVLFKIRLIQIAMLQYHTSFAEAISQCPQQYHIIQNPGIFTLNWFDDYSASLDHTPPPYRLDHLLQTPWRQQG